MYDFAFLNHNYTYINTYLSMHEMRVKINLHKICTHTIFKFCFNQSHFFYRIDFIPIFADKIHVKINLYSYSFLAQWWTKHSLPSLVQLGHDDVLCLLGSCLGREVNDVGFVLLLVKFV